MIAKERETLKKQIFKRFQVLDFKFYTAPFLLKNIEHFQCVLDWPQCYFLLYT